MWALLIIFGVATWLYFFRQRESRYYAEKGVKCLPISKIPFMGHMLSTLTRSEHSKDSLNRVYNAFPGERYIGYHQFLNHMLVITDLDLIKQIGVKDFDHFTDHLATIDDKTDSLLGNNLFALQGQKWRDMRATLSPAFTSSKMRNMFDFLAKCGRQMADYYLNEMKKPENEKQGFIEVDLKDTFTRYANDVIATAAFGLEVDSFEHKENYFYCMGRKSTDFNGTLKFLKFVGYLFIPKLMKLLRIPLFPEDCKEFFRSLVRDTMANRERNHILRPDMIQILMEAKKGSLKHEKTTQAETEEAGFATVEDFHVGKTSAKRDWSEDEITAQGVIFFLAGFDTVSTVLCFTIHELALNPEIQKRLQEEVDTVADGNDGKLFYKDLQNMTYMDCVVSEIMRLWPAAIGSDRKCIKSYTLPPPNEFSQKKVTLNPGDGLWIPIFSLHHDPKYFKDPEKFDPDRFSEDRKGEIQPHSYLPFGVGPRNCIASRFALMEVKGAVFHLLHKFDFVPTTKTSNPIRLKTDTFNLLPEGGFWVGLKPRKN